MSTSTAPAEQLITVTPFGQIVSLQTKKGQGIDARQFGKADIERTTLIEWNAERQEWFIKFLNGWQKGALGTSALLFSVGLSFQDLPHFTLGEDTDRYNPSEPNLVLYFTEYEDAVRAEILLVQALRKKFGHACV